MDTVLHGVGSDVNAAGINALDQALAARTGTFPDAGGHALPVTLRIANAPFAQRGLTLVPAYLDALASRFGSGVRLVDYQADPEAVRQLINAWVGAQTEGRIPELLAAGVITPLTRLTLINAIYLKAPWATPFPAEATQPGSFTRADGSSVDVAMMSLSAGLGYAEGFGWRAVELPYVGGSLALTVIVPDDLVTFEAGLTAQALAAMTAALREREVDLALPKFSVQTATSLVDALKALGMPLAFDPNHADFSGITTQDQLFISDVIHQANIDVDEKGTTASAASAVMIAGLAAPAPPVTLRVDRPFLFALRDIPTGAIVFLGRVTDPSAKG
jgi:serpin B